MGTANVRGTVQSAHDALARLLELESTAAWEVVSAAAPALTEMAEGLQWLLEDALKAAEVDDEVLVASGISERRVRQRNLTPQERNQALARANWSGARSEMVMVTTDGVPYNLGEVNPRTVTGR